MEEEAISSIGTVAGRKEFAHLSPVLRMVLCAPEFANAVRVPAVLAGGAGPVSLEVETQLRLVTCVGFSFTLEDRQTSETLQNEVNALKLFLFRHGWWR